MDLKTGSNHNIIMPVEKVRLSSAPINHRALFALSVLHGFDDRCRYMTTVDLRGKAERMNSCRAVPLSELIM